MLTSQLVSRSRPLQAPPTANNVSSSLRTSLIRSPQHPQIRAFRFGIWSSCLDPVFQRELRRRHRTLKHKYADAVNRRLSWHDHTLVEDSSLAFRRVVGRYWTPAASRYCSRWINQDEIDNRRARACRPSYPKSSSEADSPHPSSRPSSSPLFNSPSDKYKEPDFFHVNASTESSKSQKRNSQEMVSAIEEDYVIDPITNRKVPKSDAGSVGIDIQPRKPTLKAYTPQFAPFLPPSWEQESQPVHSNGKPPVAELNEYAQINFEDWPTHCIHPTPSSTETSVHPEAAPYVFDSSTLKSEEYALNHLPLDDPIEEYDDIHEHGAGAPDVNAEKSSNVLDRSNVADSLGSSGISHVAPYCQPSLKDDQLQVELQNYGPYTYNETVAEHITPENANDMEEYRYYAPEGPEFPVKPPTDYTDLNKYRPTTFDEINDQAHAFEQYGDLEEYKAFRYRELDTTVVPEQDIVTESLKEYEAKKQDRMMPNVADTYITDSPGKLPTMDLPDAHVFSRNYSGGSGAEMANSSRDSNRGREELHEHMKSIAETSDAMDREINLNLRRARQDFTNHQSVHHPQTLTGNFARNFPEEFQETWNINAGRLLPGSIESPALDLPQEQVQSRIQSAETEHLENVSGSTNGAVLQPALERLCNKSGLEPSLKRRASAMKGDHSKLAFGADLYSKEPKGLETSFSEECGGRHTMPLYTRTYGSEPGQVAARSKSITANETPEAPSPSSGFYGHRDPEIDGIPPSESRDKPWGQKVPHSEDPTVYKILAYDPTMQTINIAETTSVVPDQASPLSPSEVLVRLSNPVKFFPHFAPLQAEGFEIVSGAGDVLVFRQVRPVKAAGRGDRPLVNPIDMMGSPTALPSAAAFVSPTGFVNYDIPRVEEDEESAEPALRSNKYVRLEEPVFSGQKWSASGKNGKSRANVGKRALIGGVWVAGILYAIGVVSEYFTTGGADGKGPTGF